MATEICENCGRAVGKLETPCVYQEHIVCSDCDTRLRSGISPVGVQPIEKTGKEFKAGMLLGFGIMILGIMFLFLPNPDFTPFGWLMIIIGGGVYVIAHVQAWWYHG